MKNSYQMYRDNKIPSSISRKTLRLYLEDWNLNHLSDREGLVVFCNIIEKEEKCTYSIPDQKYYDEP